MQFGLGFSLFDKTFLSEKMSQHTRNPLDVGGHTRGASRRAGTGLLTRLGSKQEHLEVSESEGHGLSHENGGGDGCRGSSSAFVVVCCCLLLLSSSC